MNLGEVIRVLGFLLRFFPLISLTIRIIEEASDSEGWTSEEKKEHAIAAFLAIAKALNLTLPEDIEDKLGRAIDLLVSIFNAVGIFVSNVRASGKQPAQVNVAAATAAKVAEPERLKEAERVAREEFNRIVEQNKKRRANQN